MLGSFGGGLGFGLAFVLEDQFTDAADKIRGSMGSLEGDTGKAADSIMGKMGAMAGILGVGFSFGAAIQGAAALSDQMVSVADVTNMTSNEIEGLRTQLEGMQTRTSLPELLDLAMLGSQLNVAKEDLAGFTASADAVGIVLAEDLGGSATEAIKKLTQLGKVFKDTKGLTAEEQMLKIGSAVDAMGDSAAINSGNVVQFAQKMGQLGDMGPTAAQAIGLGTAFEELGIKSKAASSKIGAIFTAMADPKKMGLFAEQIGMGTEAFQTLFNTNPNEALLQLAESFKKQGLSSTETMQRLKALGIPGAEMAKIMEQLSENTDLVRKRQTEATQAFNDGNGVLSEAAKRNETFGAKLEMVQRNFSILLTRVGDAVAVAFGPLLDVINWIIQSFTALAATPIGKEVISWTVSIVAMAGAAIGLAKGMKMVSGALSMVKTQALKTLVALGPYIAIAAPFIIIGFAIMKAVSAFSEFDGVVQGGLGGFFQRLGGIIAGIQEIWNSWDSVNQSFEISGETMEKLNQLGIGGLVVGIGTYVVRIQEFLSGVMSGFSEAFSFVWSVVQPVLSAIGQMLTYVGLGFDKTTSATKGWAIAGKIVGAILVGVLVAIAVAAASAAISMIIAFFPVILVIAAIAAGIYILVYAWDWFMSVLSGAWDFLGAIFDWGANLINYIWEGIKSAWKGFTGWLWSSVTSVPLVGPAIKWLFGSGDANPDDSLNKAADGKAGSPEIQRAVDEMGTSGIMEAGATMKGETGGGGAGESWVNINPAETIIQLDGETIGRATTNYQNNDLSKQ